MFLFAFLLYFIINLISWTLMRRKWFISEACKWGRRWTPWRGRRDKSRPVSSFWSSVWTCAPTVCCEATVSQHTQVFFKSAPKIVSLAGGLAPSCEVYCFRKSSLWLDRKWVTMFSLQRCRSEVRGWAWILTRWDLSPALHRHLQASSALFNKREEIGLYGLF